MTVFTDRAISRFLAPPPPPPTSHPRQKVAVFVMKERGGGKRCSCSVAHGTSCLFHPHNCPLSASVSSGVYITVSASVWRADVWTGRSILESLLKVIEMTQ